MASSITKISFHIPSKTLPNEFFENIAPQLSADKIETKLGIKNRHIVDENETALDMAYQACIKLFQDFDKTQVDFLILCTQSPDYHLPTTACVLQDKLGLPTTVGAFDFNLGCSGYIYGLGIAKGLIVSGQAKNVLLVTSETYSKHIHPQDIANRTIFGDAASASIVSESDTDNILQFVYGTDGSGMNNLIVPNGGMRNAYNANAPVIEYSEGNLTTNNNLFMNGPEIFNFTIGAVPKLITQTLEKNNLSLDDIDFFIFHQANKYMLDYLRKKTGIPTEKYYNNMIETGNTVSSTIPIALKNSIDQNLVKKGDKVLLCGFGVGYSWGATIIII